jgi:RES domain-containing protein
MPGDLAERVSTAPRRHYEGSAFRHQSPRHDPLSGEGGRLAGGRFNPPESFPVIYLCTTRACAVAEFRRFSTRQPIGAEGFLPRVLYEYQIAFASVLDLTDAAILAHLELEAGLLVDQDRSLTQQLGELTHQFGYQALCSPSATGVDVVLAVFTDNLRTGRIEPQVAERWETIADL